MCKLWLRPAAACAWQRSGSVQRAGPVLTGLLLAPRPPRLLPPRPTPLLRPLLVVLLLRVRALRMRRGGRPLRHYVEHPGTACVYTCV